MLRAIWAAALIALVVIGLSACGSAKAAVWTVGDCSKPFHGLTQNGTIEGVEVVDCAQAHDQEVFLAFQLPQGTFPGAFTIGDAQQDECSSAFEDYVGISWEQSSYTFDTTGPSEEMWKAGDRWIYCFLKDPHGGMLTGSAKGAAR
jgi:hypothetical protein